MKNYYHTLRVSRNATTEEIKTSYRRLALKHHPDVNNSSNAHEVFIEICEAYEILSTFEKRELYDELYSSHFGNRMSNDLLNQKETYEQWQSQARNTATSYAQMSIRDFKLKILDAVVKLYDFSKKLIKILIGVAFVLFWMYMLSHC